MEKHVTFQLCFGPCSCYNSGSCIGTSLALGKSKNPQVSVNYTMLQGLSSINMSKFAA